MTDRDDRHERVFVEVADLPTPFAEFLKPLLVGMFRELRRGESALFVSEGRGSASDLNEAWAWDGSVVVQAIPPLPQGCWIVVDSQEGVQSIKTQLFESGWQPATSATVKRWHEIMKVQEKAYWEWLRLDEPQQFKKAQSFRPHNLREALGNDV